MLKFVYGVNSRFCNTDPRLTQKANLCLKRRRVKLPSPTFELKTFSFLTLAAMVGGGHLSRVDPFAPSIFRLLQPQVQIPSTQSMLFHGLNDWYYQLDFFIVLKKNKRNLIEFGEFFNTHCHTLANLVRIEDDRKCTTELETTQRIDFLRVLGLMELLRFISKLPNRA